MLKAEQSGPITEPLWNGAGQQQESLCMQNWEEDAEVWFAGHRQRKEIGIKTSSFYVLNVKKPFEKLKE